jgi:hypothetical protein
MGHSELGPEVDDLAEAGLRLTVLLLAIRGDAEIAMERGVVRLQQT